MEVNWELDTPNSTEYLQEKEEQVETLSEEWRLLIGYFLTYGSPAINWSGISLNCLGMATLINMGVTSTSFVFMFLLLFSATVEGFFRAAIDILRSVDINLYLISEAGCHLSVWASNAMNHTTQFMLVLLTFDRVIAASIPFKYRTLKLKTTQAWAAGGVVASISYFLNSGHLIFFQFSHRNCSPKDDLPSQMFYFFNSLGLSWLIPGSLILVFNIVILVQIKRKTTAKSSVNEKDITRLLLVTSGCFLIVTAFVPIIRVLANFYVVPENGMSANLLRQLSIIPGIISRSLNFVLYVCGGRVFRAGFVQLVKKILGKKAQHLTSTVGAV